MRIQRYRRYIRLAAWAILWSMALGLYVSQSLSPHPSLQPAAIVLIPFVLIMLGLGALGPAALGPTLPLIAGALAILYALAIYVLILGTSLPYKAWLLPILIVSVTLGVSFLGKALFGTSSSDKIDELRQKGPGATDDSQERKEWIEHQSRRSYWLRTIILAIMVMAAAFYAYNHVIVTQPDPPYLHWQTHAERQNSGNQHQTVMTDTLATVAQQNNIGLEALVLANPDAQLLISDVVTSTVKPAFFLGTAGMTTTVPLEVAAVAAHEPTSADGFRTVALSFASVPLVPGQKLSIPTPTAADPRIWLDWILWGLIGVSIYLLLQVAQFYRLIPKGKADFIAETPWYVTQLLSGPIIAFVVLMFLTNFNLSVLGDQGGKAIAIDFSLFPRDLLFVAAFLLGFYSRVAREVLDQIMQSLFSAAWRAATDKFTIVIQGKPDEDIVQSGSTVILETSPMMPVTWLASAGTIGSSGAFVSPANLEAPQDVTITAVASGAGSSATAAKVLHIVPFKFSVVVVDNNAPSVARGKSIDLTMDPLPADAELEKITWKVDATTIPVTWNPKTGAKTTVTIPANFTEATVSVHATYKSYSPSISLTVSAS